MPWWPTNVLLNFYRGPGCWCWVWCSRKIKNRFISKCQVMYRLCCDNVFCIAAIFMITCIRRLYCCAITPLPLSVSFLWTLLMWLSIRGISFIKSCNIWAPLSLKFESFCRIKIRLLITNIIHLSCISCVYLFFSNGLVLGLLSHFLILVISFLYRNLAVGIGIQNFPEGLAVSLPLRAAGFTPLKSFW